MYAVGVLIFWADLADDRCVGDIFTSIGRDVTVVDKEEGIRSLDALYCYLCVPSYPLEEAAYLIGVGRGPGGCILGMLTELVILHDLARLLVKYWQSHDTGDGCVCPGALSNGQIRRLWGWRQRGEDGVQARAVCYWVFWCGLVTYGYPW